VSTVTLPLPAVNNLRITAADTSSAALTWNTVSGITGYQIYFAQSATEPDEGAYASLTSPGAGDTGYTHTGLSTGNTYWYKIRAVWAVHGNGPWSMVRFITLGAPDLTAAIDMATYTLDADFEDVTKAASSADKRLQSNSDNSNYQFDGLYAANDADYLYVALKYDKAPSMWQNDWITVWIDNTKSATGGAATNGTYSIAQFQTFSPAATVEYSFSQRQNGLTQTTATDNPVNVTKNGSWAGEGNLWSPTLPAGFTGSVIVKYRIPLVNIGYAAVGDELRIAAANTQGWNSAENPTMGGFIPMSAITSFVEGEWGEVQTITIDMSKALAYTVK
jgi:hypothetical protein